MAALCALNAQRTLGLNFQELTEPKARYCCDSTFTKSAVSNLITDSGGAARAGADPLSFNAALPIVTVVVAVVDAIVIVDASVKLGVVDCSSLSNWRSSLSSGKSSH
jgi:hypothetical protein